MIYKISIKMEQSHEILVDAPNALAAYDDAIELIDSDTIAESQEVDWSASPLDLEPGTRYWSGGPGGYWTSI